jgi:hypothetical protein
MASQSYEWRDGPGAELAQPVIRSRADCSVERYWQRVMIFRRRPSSENNIGKKITARERRAVKAPS